MIISRWYCYLKGLVRSLESVLTHGIVFSGHSLVEIEQYDNVSVSVCRCSICGKQTISWSKRGR